VKVRCTYGRYASQHKLDAGSVYIILRHTAYGVRQPQYDTVFFPHPDGEDIIDTALPVFDVVGTVPPECVVEATV
jgi:hypothetical protein